MISRLITHNQSNNSRHYHYRLQPWVHYSYKLAGSSRTHQRVLLISFWAEHQKAGSMHTLMRELIDKKKKISVAWGIADAKKKHVYHKLIQLDVVRLQTANPWITCLNDRLCFYLTFMIGVMNPRSAKHNHLYSNYKLWEAHLHDSEKPRKYLSNVAAINRAMSHVTRCTNMDCGKCLIRWILHAHWKKHSPVT